MFAIFLILAASVAVTVGAAPNTFPVLTVPAYSHALGLTSDIRSGSVIAADSDAATISLDCAKTRVDCSLFPQQTLTIGPLLYNMHYGSGNDSTSTQACDLAKAVCTEDFSAAGATSTNQTTVTYSGEQVATLAIVLTAGAYLLEGQNRPVMAGTPAAVSSGPSACTGSISPATTTSPNPSATRSTSSSESATSSLPGPPEFSDRAGGSRLLVGNAAVGFGIGLLALVL